MRGGNIFFLLPLLPFHLVLCVPLLLLPVCDLLVLVSPVGALSRPSYRDNHPSIHPTHPTHPLIGLSVLNHSMLI